MGKATYKELEGKNCPIFNSLHVISKKWMVFILLEFYKNKSKKMRYSEIKKVLPGITSRTLSMRLRELMSAHILEKEVDYKTTPPVQKYFLTNAGKNLCPTMVELRNWVKKNIHCSFNKTCDRCKI